MQTPDELGALAEAFNSLAAQLQEMIDTLAERVAERTRDLEQRSIQIEAASEIAREAAAIRNVGELLNQTVHLISDRFGFYHAGIFSLDPTGEYAVLQAASSEGGKRMLARGHRLRVGSVGIVGYAAGVGEPRIALNVGADTIYFDNPDLPLTRSEMALPLKVRERVIGVLDVQSVEENAFTEDDVAILQTLADQVALAIDNTRLLGESQRALQELEAFHGEKVRQDWQEQIARQAPAFRYSQAGVTTATADVLQQAASLPLHGRPVVLQDQDDRRLIAPIRLREEAFGSIVLSQEPGQAPWSAEELALIEEVSNQVALALENARLLQDTRRRASQEHLISEVTANVRESLDLDAILQTAVREIGEKLNIAEVEIRMGSGTNHEEKGGPA
jgi:GAF domain-containing protein